MPNGAGAVGGAGKKAMVTLGIAVKSFFDNTGVKKGIRNAKASMKSMQSEVKKNDKNIRDSQKKLDKAKIAGKKINTALEKSKDERKRLGKKYSDKEISAMEKSRGMQKGSLKESMDQARKKTGAEVKSLKEKASKSATNIKSLEDSVAGETRLKDQTMAGIGVQEQGIATTERRTAVFKKFTGTAAKGYNFIGKSLKSFGSKVSGVIKGMTRFRMEFLSVMFFGMAIGRIFEGYIKSVKDMVGINKMWAVSMQSILLPALIPVAIQMTKITSAIIALPKEMKLAVSAIMFGVTAFGKFMFIIGTTFLGLHGIFIAFVNLIMILTGAILGIFTLGFSMAALTIKMLMSAASLIFWDAIAAHVAGTTSILTVLTGAFTAATAGATGAITAMTIAMIFLEAVTGLLLLSIGLIMIAMIAVSVIFSIMGAVLSVLLVPIIFALLAILTVFGGFLMMILAPFILLAAGAMAVLYESFLKDSGNIEKAKNMILDWKDKALTAIDDFLKWFGTINWKELWSELTADVDWVVAQVRNFLAEIIGKITTWAKENPEKWKDFWTGLFTFGTHLTGIVRMFLTDAKNELTKMSTSEEWKGVWAGMITFTDELGSLAADMLLGIINFLKKWATSDRMMEVWRELFAVSKEQSNKIGKGFAKVGLSIAKAVVGAMLTGFEKEGPAGWLFSKTIKGLYHFQKGAGQWLGSAFEDPLWLKTLYNVFKGSPEGAQFGGIVTKPSILRVAETVPEAIIPLTKLDKYMPTDIISKLNEKVSGIEDKLKGIAKPLAPIIKSVINPIINFEPLFEPTVNLEPSFTSIVKPMFMPVINPVIAPIIKPVPMPVIKPIITPVIEPKMLRAPERIAPIIKHTEAPINITISPVIHLVTREEEKLDARKLADEVSKIWADELPRKLRR